MSAAVTQKGGRPEFEGKKKLDLLDTFQLCKMGKTVRSGSVSHWVSIDVQKKKREADLSHSFETYPSCQPALEPDTLHGS